MTTHLCNSKCHLSGLVYLFQHLFFTCFVALTSLSLLLLQTPVWTTFVIMYLKIACSLQCIPVPITSQCPPCNCECWGGGFVESYFLTLLFLCPGLSYPYANSQHNQEEQGEQLGWGKKWEIIQLLSLPKQTHCVPAPSAYGSQALKKERKWKKPQKTPMIQKMCHAQYNSR